MDLLKNISLTLFWIVALFTPWGGRAGVAADGNGGSSEQRIHCLVAQLGDNDYSVRQDAQEKLAKLGFRAYDALTAAASSVDLEVASRARYLLLLARSSLSTPDDSPLARDLLQGYSYLSQKERSKRIGRLAALSNSAGLPALCRIVRFEKCSALSSQAGLVILEREPQDKSLRQQQAATIRENLAGSHCRAAAWLLAYLRYREDPIAGFAEWARCVESEAVFFNRSPRQADAAVVALLLYHLAEAQSRQGNQAEADRTAGRALQIVPLNDPSQLIAHHQLAVSLQHRGRFKWAEGEYRRLASANSPQMLLSGTSGLAEMLHDVGNDQSAAEAICTALEKLKREKWHPDDGDRGRIRNLRARMHYFLACHWKEKDEEKENDELKKALDEDPCEVNSLIAYYRYPAPGQKEDARNRIKKAIGHYHSIIADEQDPASYNEFAWLVANTEGNLDEALDCAKKCLELSPDTAAFLDTLAHVYFAKGDHREAMEYEMQAARLEPHSGLIAKELQGFRAAAEKKNAMEKKK